MLVVEQGRKYKETSTEPLPLDWSFYLAGIECSRVDCEDWRSLNINISSQVLAGDTVCVSRAAAAAQARAAAEHHQLNTANTASQQERGKLRKLPLYLLRLGRREHPLAASTSIYNAYHPDISNRYDHLFRI